MRDRSSLPTTRRTAAGLVTAMVVCSLLVGWATVPTSAVDGVDAPVSPAERRASATSGGLQATVTPSTIAAGVGDAVEVSGSTSAPTVRLYLVGPRGTFLGPDGRAERMGTARVASDAFSKQYTAFSRRGTYTLLVVSPGGDSFASDKHLGRGSLPSEVTRRQAIDMVRSAYAGDEVVELTVQGRTPSLGIDSVSDDGTVTYGTDLSVSGTSNRGDGTDVAVELLDGSERTRASVAVTVDGPTGEWEGSLDTADLEPGTYTLLATTDASRASALVVIAVNETGTPAETPMVDDDTPAPSGDSDQVAAAKSTLDNATGAALTNGTDGLDAASGTNSQVTGAAPSNGTNATTNGTTDGSANGTATGDDGSTSGSLPGFGIGAVLAAVAVVLAIFRRRPTE